MNKSPLMLLLLLIGMSSAQEPRQVPQEEYLCTTNLPVSSPVNGVTIVGNRALLKTGRITTSVWMTLRNDGDSPVVEYATLLEGFDASGKRTNGIVFHEMYGEVQDPIHPYKQSSAPYPMGPIYQLSSPLQPGESLEMFGVGPMVTSRCPATAVLSFVFLKFADGTTTTHASPGWRTDPAVRMKTDEMVLDGCPIPKRVGSTAVMTVDSKGKVQSLAFGTRIVPAAAADCLRRELALWEFEPALVEGQPVASRVNLVVLLDVNEERVERWEHEYAQEVIEGATLLDLEPLPDQHGKWVANIGSGCCNAASTFHP